MERNYSNVHTVVGKLEQHDLVRRTPEDAVKVCQTYFGKPRQDGSSHAIFKTPWPGDPRVNIQNAKGKAKPYQVMQVLRAIDKIDGKS